MRDLKVILVQTNQFWEDKKANFKHLEEEHFSKITPGECDLILLPEMFNTSFSMNVSSLAESMNDKSISWLHNQSNRLNCRIAATLIIKHEQNFYNRFIIVYNDKIEAIYDKRHLFRMAGENEYFTAGEKRIIYSLKGWNILLQTCYDLRFPVFSRNKTIDDRQEYDLILYLANWPEKRSNIWKILLQARAIENQAYVIGLNRIGTDGKHISYSGDSLVVDPWGTIENNLDSEEKIQLALLKANTLQKIRHDFPAFRDAD